MPPQLARLIRCATLPCVLDLHLHTWPHQQSAPTPSMGLLELYCSTAAARGISQIAITEHSHRFTRIFERVLPEWRRPHTGAVAEATDHVLAVEGGADLDAYVAALLAGQDAGLPLLIGLEVDFLPGAMTAMAEVLEEYPFDVLLGSVHWLDAWLFDAYGTDVFAAQWEERDTDAVFAQYVGSVLELTKTGIVDVLAHLDVIRVAGHQARRLEEHEARLVAGLSDADVVVEFSSAGLRKPVADTYPSDRLLDALLGVGIGLTTASDGHTVDQIGLGFEVLTEALDAKGIDQLTTFRRRERLVYQRQSS